MRPTDFTRVEEAIRYLRTHAKTQPSLREVAEHVGLSASHFQRLFTRWAGVSPKRFLQFLTVQHAKEAVRTAPNLLDATWNVGLSSPSRLHDLFVSVEAVTPGEFSRQGSDLTIRYGVHETPFGLGLIATTERGICSLQFLSAADDQPVEILREAWPRADLHHDPAEGRAMLDRVFGSTEGAPLPVLLKGTNFQLQVWQALLSIPPGQMTTYGAIGAQIGRANASRAVGRAVGANPIAFLIPCHRVIQQSGILGGYRWGVDRKAAILGWEAARRERAVASCSA